MCGRYASSRRPEDLVALFQVTRWNPEEVLPPSWNVAPTDGVWAALERPDRGTGELERQLRTRWGLVPSWAKDPGVGARMINARVESVQEKSSFRTALAKRRCLIPADGYYEWLTPTAKGGKKQPYFITTKDGSPIVFAGLYEFWRDPRLPREDPTSWLTTCTIITTAAEPELARIHDRMPVILPADRWCEWLDPTVTDLREARALLDTPEPGRMRSWPVATAVGNVRNNTPDLVEPLAEEP
ncbi:SOS response-associated peptidase [Streptomyces sp. H10-C2]|uniref:SOS response-associated peptidase n=1 Tax=unclassified Streptomyces TaxID=2593676 RepID=UPI0024B93A7F|nr:MULTISPECIES: SOS response-associated peptidase [unclassified Streptomyces]MDJ0347312.1 SOS response-associated peptidase [Streptomyces sp. PH10-H1]MDJ0375109.1 SOS response-associated peptidase [Streptomyces sp. H10-C2]